ncbi:MAG: nitrous oxide reductase accessory protein NosL [Azoarcus sp.]|jgi:hypothetical protein|nr:nitrous oxide reductase accessory protein NosL [Azoarcus sp.]
MGYRFFVFAAALLSLAACEKSGNWPEGMEPIHWDRDTCAQCGMAISDPRFAVEVRVNKPKKGVYKFDDIGCLVAWTNTQSRRTGLPPWWKDKTARAWVADFSSPVENRDMLNWLNVLTVRYIERTSPMGHNYAAVENPKEESVSFEEILWRGQLHAGHEGH